MPVKMVRVGDLYGSSDSQNLLKVLLAGPPGSGKTRLASTFPKPVYLDAEGRLLSIRDRPDIPVFRIASIGDVEEVYAMLHQEPRVRRSLLGGYDVQTVVLDTVDEVLKLLMKERINAERVEVPRFQDWNYFADRGRAMLRGFRNLDLNVVINVHIRETSDQETGRTEKRPDVSGALGNELPAFVDEVWLLRQRSSLDPQTGLRRVERFLQTVGDTQFDWLKDHSGAMPSEFPVNLLDDYQRIAAEIFPATKNPAPAPQAVAKGSPDAPDVPPLPVPNGKVVSEDPPRRVKGRATKTAVIDVPLPEADVEPAPPAQVEAPQAEATVAVSEAEPAPEVVSEIETQSEVSAPSGPTCAVCGQAIENPDVAELSEIRFGEQLCPEHFKARRDAK